MAMNRRIGQAAAEIGMSEHTLRYSAKMGLLPHLGRDGNGVRSFSDEDMNWLDFIRRLRDTGMPIAEIKRYVDLAAQGDSTYEERLELLRAHRRYVAARLEEWQHCAEVIDQKIAMYQVHACSGD
jgi:DNA-binding transcriptional MerR regulator